jgi:hypothetical protein
LPAVSVRWLDAVALASASSACMSRTVCEGKARRRAGARMINLGQARRIGE